MNKATQVLNRCLGKNQLFGTGGRPLSPPDSQEDAVNIGLARAHLAQQGITREQFHQLSDKEQDNAMKGFWKNRQIRGK